MLKDDAIREGLMTPTETDIERMSLTKVDLANLADKRAAAAEKPAVKTTAPATTDTEKDHKDKGKPSGR